MERYSPILGARASFPEQAHAFVMREMSAPHRHYHVVQHLALMLMDLKLDFTKVLSFEERHLFAATLFHDVWLVPGAPDNEERSAAAAREHLRGLEFDFDYLDALIIATKLHALGSITDETTRRLVKADLSILWNPNPRTYAWYARGIRAEYALAPADAYQAGRTKLLRKFEAEIAPHIEPADAEMMSRNIAWEISMIEEGKIA